MKTLACIALLLCVISMAGCQTKTVDDLRIQNQQNLRSVEVGMSQLDVMKIMGDGCVTAFRDTGLGRPALPAACNPYKVESIIAGNTAYEVLFYVVEKKVDDAAVTDDELLPMFFEDDILKGTGHSFLKCQ
ncbi:MAG: DUF3192 domain-containing protein [Planctomycetota bacterium]